MNIYKPGAAYYAEAVTTTPSTGAAADADSLPVATATKNGVDDGAFALTVTKIDTGRYKITGTVPAYSAGDRVQVSLAATCSGIVGKAVVDLFTVDTSYGSDIHAEVGNHPTLAEIEASTVLAKEGNIENHVVNAINSVASSFTRSEASILADGTEQELYINDAPADNWILDNIKLDLSVLQADDSVTVRFYARMVAAGAYKLFDSQNFSDVQAVPAILVTGLANRYGLKITLQQTAGTYRTFVTEAMVIA